MTEQDWKICPNPWCDSTSYPVCTSTYLEKGLTGLGYQVICPCGVKAPIAETFTGAIAEWNRDREITIPEKALVPQHVYRHLKRGSAYDVYGTGRLQCEPDYVLKDDDLLVIYRDDDGMIWLRRNEEFLDGRFELLCSYPDPCRDGLQLPKLDPTDQ